MMVSRPAAFGRLCVETDWLNGTDNGKTQPPSGGCVLKQSEVLYRLLVHPSRLRAAVC